MNCLRAKTRIKGISIGLGFMCLVSCGGNTKNAYPIYLPLDNVQHVEEYMTEISKIPPEGLIEPVAVTTIEESGYLALDILVALPKNIPSKSNANDIFESIFNGLAVFNAAEGRGFVVRNVEGMPLQLEQIDLSRPTSSIGNVLTLPKFESAAIDSEDHVFRGFIVTILRIPLKIDRIVTLSAAEICVRLSSEVRNYWGLQVSDREVCGR